MQKYPEVRKMLDEAISENSSMRKSRSAQMRYLYDNIWANKWVIRYPVTRIESEIELPVN